MSFQEKLTWVSAVVWVLVISNYVRAVGSQLGVVPVTEIAYRRPILFAMGALIVLTIVGAIAVAIGSAVAAALRGESSADDIDRKDERDARIAQRGDVVGYYASSVVLVGAFALILLEAPYFWIANAVFATLALGGLAAATAKLLAYRLGL